MEDWAQIRRLHGAEGVSARAIAKQLGIGGCGFGLDAAAEV